MQLETDKILKQYFKLLIVLNDEQIIEFIKISHTLEYKNINYFTKVLYYFRINHPIICKIPYLNWFIFKKYFK